MNYRETRAIDTFRSIGRQIERIRLADIYFLCLTMPSGFVSRGETHLHICLRMYFRPSQDYSTALYLTCCTNKDTSTQIYLNISTIYFLFL